jgi:Sec-independent protein translocase protein TatA
MRSLGSGTREFKKGMRGEKEDEKPADTAAKTEGPAPAPEEERDDGHPGLHLGCGA